MRSIARTGGITQNASFPNPHLLSPLVSGYLARAQNVDLTRDIPIPSQQMVLELLQYSILLRTGEMLAMSYRRRSRASSNAHMERTLERLLLAHCVPLKVQLGDADPGELRNVLMLNEKLEMLLTAPIKDIDAIVIELCRWFKHDYMRWIDPIPCPRCGGKTQETGYDQPTRQEAADGGGRVEVHRCEDAACATVRRFVRYTTVSMLSKNREGRCGEWAHLFYVFLQLCGVRARYIWNSEDHVWCEYWSDGKQHWVHVDPCENSVDKPMLYDMGWGKKQAFCLAYGRSGAEDVTRAYVADFETGCQARRRAIGWSEKALRLALREDTISCRLQLEREDRVALVDIDRQQASWMADAPRRVEEARLEKLGGRISGPEEWRKARAEMGTKSDNRKPKVTVSRPLDMLLLGDARYRDSILLTNGADQTSAAFTRYSFSQDISWRAQISFALHAPDGAGEADGIAIVFSNERKLGDGGSGIGYSGIGDKGDFAVEVDTYRAQDRTDDPPTPHISVHSPPNAHHRHSLSCTAAGDLPYLSDGAAYTLELLFNGSTRALAGYFRPQGGPQSLEIQVCNVKIPKPDGPAQDWYMGITGSCGGLWQEQKILEWKLEQIDIDPEGARGPDTEGL